MKVKLSDICDIVKGRTTITKAIEGEYPLVVTGENRLCNNEFQFDCSAVCVPLVSATGHGHASIKRIHYQEGKFALGSILAAVIPKSTDEVNPRYLHIYLSYFKDSVLVPLMRGSANVSLTIKSLGSAEIELPSIDKQLEIVRVISKVEKMKGEIDKYLINQENIISNMKKEILQLAVQGKLVPQDPNDESAEVLLGKIREEKEKLIKEKKIKKEKPLADISEDEKSFELPTGWVWTRLGELGITQTGTTPSTKIEEYFNGTVPFIKPADISEKGINYENESLTELGLTKGRLILKNSVMMVCIGGSIGKNYYTSMDCSCNQQINTITPLANIDSKFVHYLLSSSNFYNKILELSTGSATPIINKSKWEQIIIQLPPLEEQKRIVEKVDSLIKLCDKLENKIEKQKIYNNKLMESILKSSLSR